MRASKEEAWVRAKEKAELKDKSGKKKFFFYFGQILYKNKEFILSVTIVISTLFTTWEQRKTLRQVGEMQEQLTQMQTQVTILEKKNPEGIFRTMAGPTLGKIAKTVGPQIVFLGVNYLTNKVHNHQFQNQVKGEAETKMKEIHRKADLDLQNLQKSSEDEIQNLQKSYQDEIQNLQKSSEDEIQRIQKSYDDPMQTLQNQLEDLKAKKSQDRIFIDRLKAKNGQDQRFIDTLKDDRDDWKEKLKNERGKNRELEDRLGRLEDLRKRRRQSTSSSKPVTPRPSRQESYQEQEERVVKKQKQITASSLTTNTPQPGSTIQKIYDFWRKNVKVIIDVKNPDKRESEKPGYHPLPSFLAPSSTPILKPDFKLPGEKTVRNFTPKRIPKNVKKNFQKATKYLEKRAQKVSKEVQKAKWVKDLRQINWGKWISKRKIKLLLNGKNCECQTLSTRGVGKVSFVILIYQIPDVRKDEIENVENKIVRPN